MADNGAKSLKQLAAEAQVPQTSTAGKPRPPKTSVNSLDPTSFIKDQFKPADERYRDLDTAGPANYALIKSAPAPKLRLPEAIDIEGENAEIARAFEQEKAKDVENAPVVPEASSSSRRKNKKRKIEREVAPEAASDDEPTTAELAAAGYHDNYTPRSPKRGMQPLPNSFAEAQPYDQELWKMAIDHKGWVEIGDVWEKLSGNPPYKRVIDRSMYVSVRFQAMKQNFAAHGNLDLPVDYPLANWSDHGLREVNRMARQDPRLEQAWFAAEESIKEQRLETFKKILREGTLTEESKDWDMEECVKRVVEMRNGVPSHLPEASRQRLIDLLAGKEVKEEKKKGKGRAREYGGEEEWDDEDDFEDDWVSGEEFEDENGGGEFEPDEEQL